MRKTGRGADLLASYHGCIPQVGQIKDVSMLAPNMRFTNSTAQAQVEVARSSLNVVTMRLWLLQALKQQVRGWNITRPQAARRLGILPGRLDDLLSGAPTSFSLDELIRLAPSAGLLVRFDISVNEEMLS